ncbi:MAG: hypothetical protein A2Z34_06955 [Planctomycetes bacterium RBG_16_59_8]|nr:MAG: hypothetical protein A2Z34_06955 [Planctomycetes bacterium RBG_16_59_8]
MIVESLSVLTTIVLAAPLALFIALSLPSLLNRPPSERVTGFLVRSALLTAGMASLGMAGLMAFLSVGRLDISLGSMVVIDRYTFEFKLLIDGVTMPYLILILTLCGITGAFAHRYLHREPGYNRFFVLYALFVIGMEFSALAGSMETLIGAWELVGLSSVLLIGFFHERPEPVRNGLRVWIIYRIGDLGLIFAACLAHHWVGTGSFEALFGQGAPALPDGSLWILGLLILLAAMGKSALFPFSNWLPRAMEGPTPSSAIFYGALSVHLGAFLLLRAGALLDGCPGLSWLVFAVGLVTALYSTFAGRVQTDIKSALAYASLTQVGIIVAEIGLGLRLLPLIHICGHACMRTLQFLRAPSLLHDLHRVENAMGRHLPRTGLHLERLLPSGIRTRLYRGALERGYLDALLRDWVARPFLAVAELFNRLELWWIDTIGGNGR